MSSSPIVFGLITTAILSLASGCTEIKAHPIEHIKTIPTTKAERVSAPAKILYGKVQSEIGYDIALFNSGRIEKMSVKEGQVVSKNMLIARLYSPNLKSQVAEKEATLSAALAAAEEADSELQRVTNLQARSLASLATLEQAKKSAKVANDTVTQMRAQLTQAKNALDEFSIYAPQDGIIASLYAREGQFVPSESPILSFSEAGKHKVEYLVPEQEAVNLDIGQTVSIFIPTFSKHVTGIVSEKAIPTIKGPSLFKVSVLIKRPDNNLLGLTAQLHMPSTNKQVYRINANAVRFKPNGQSYLLDNAKKRVHIELIGTRDDDLLFTAASNLDGIQFNTSPEPIISTNLMAALEGSNDR
ncbi:efflux RND transporter periplasmic adaptor subunit [Pseudoalteromonas luteoviolacea]|uniref:Uncharacterized protein n=1 Tax=Pseudoalteromonas luteoviolacea S4054 TaxID=1129367 RepID=A0A0F6A567_9GAMM|nr:efflux RND transporter periplasmic adaptor subunit [Pseudoalteromonas luteoviolacea]AOT10719.1 hypothetical protein S4054249_22960 [Pseudoalteromonas luteoviolacea]AOT16119.1 hypothetical protein S40542_25550 [Pseudoalteromonas luteoviolacea]AOT20539.1 hypothetical protein S4054_22875 [Pseudoalteromonas luteoviolacea]KKE81248.1 hypothetical protein N479_22990 [Pseudoalteromonas luteoviolacea S4054]KZN68989.1 hypothetical protein N481_22870 [Pseudoalteromonas luteoviolacea S4047-1]